MQTALAEGRARRPWLLKMHGDIDSEYLVLS